MKGLQTYAKIWTHFTYNIHLLHLQHPPTSPTTSTHFTKKFCGGDSFSKSINRLVHHKTKGEFTQHIHNTISATSLLSSSIHSIHLSSYPSPITLPYSLNLFNPFAAPAINHHHHPLCRSFTKEEGEDYLGAVPSHSRRWIVGAFLGVIYLCFKCLNLIIFV